jgi:DNA-directed RNA polymerase specialized sigma24 family protein
MEVGVAETFDDAFGRLFRAAYRVAYRLLGDREDAADARPTRGVRPASHWSP